VLHALLILLDHPRLTLTAGVAFVVVCLGVATWAHISLRNDLREDEQ
jgi:hypothetical protein